MVGWATVYPLDVVKTMVQVQGGAELPGRPLAAQVTRGALSSGYGAIGAWGCVKKAYRDGGMKVFWNGIWVCLGRAFIVSTALLTALRSECLEVY